MTYKGVPPGKVRSELSVQPGVKIHFLNFAAVAYILALKVRPNLTTLKLAGGGPVVKVFAA